MKRYAAAILIGVLCIGTNLGFMSPVRAADSPAQDYVECMDRAEVKLAVCLEKASETECLCWSRFGYAKIWCSVKYVVGSIF